MDAVSQLKTQLCRVVLYHVANSCSMQDSLGPNSFSKSRRFWPGRVCSNFRLDWVHDADIRYGLKTCTKSTTRRIASKGRCICLSARVPAALQRFLLTTCRGVLGQGGKKHLDWSFKGTKDCLAGWLARRGSYVGSGWRLWSRSSCSICRPGCLWCSRVCRIQDLF